MRIENNVFLITGGASGLGAGTARMIVGEGGKVLLADVREAEGNAFASELGANARFCRTDVTD
jgi:NADP-dependent 3-hydroxy acid dehydrogenase YdfG